MKSVHIHIVSAVDMFSVTIGNAKINPVIFVNLYARVIDPSKMVTIQNRLLKTTLQEKYTDR
jgi:hypothetical protein